MYEMIGAFSTVLLRNIIIYICYVVVKNQSELYSIFVSEVSNARILAIGISVLY